jgi:hypothetical protein
LTNGSELLKQQYEQAKAEHDSAAKQLHDLNQKLAQKLPLALFQQVSVEPTFSSASSIS